MGVVVSVARVAIVVGVIFARTGIDFAQMSSLKYTSRRRLESTSITSVWAHGETFHGLRARPDAPASRSMCLRCRDPAPSGNAAPGEAVERGRMIGSALRGRRRAPTGAGGC